MKQKIRNYNLSDADLMLYTSNLVQSMTRDAVEFANRGVDAAAITALEDLGDEFEVFPSDESMLGLITIAVENKNTLRDSLLIKIQLVSGFFEQKWGLRSGQYTRLGIRNIHKMKDSQFLRAARGVVVVATEYLSDLTSEGLTQSLIDDVATNAQSFEDALNAIDNAIENRDLKTRERIDKGNELYSYVKKYSLIGKLIWENVDTAKYEDYVIRKTVNSGLSKPQNLQATQNTADPELIDLSWSQVDDATSYDIYVDITQLGTPSGQFNLLNTTSDTFITVPGVLNERNHFKIRAKNAGKVSDYSDEVFIDLELPTD